LKSFYSIAPVNAFSRLVDSVSIADRPSRVQCAEIRFKSRAVTRVSNRRPAAANQSYIFVMKTMSAQPALRVFVRTGRQANAPAQHFQAGPIAV
jgi:hypothetical protein